MIRSLGLDDCAKLKQLHLDVWGMPPRGFSQLEAQYDRLFPRLFLENPWSETGVHSVISCDGDRINGLVGVLPRRFRLHDERLNVAVTTQFCVAQQDRGKMVAVKLMHQLMRGSLDVTVADDYDPDTARLLKAFGAVEVPSMQLRWFRVLRLFGSLADGISRLPKLSRSRRLSAPIARLSDRILPYLFIGSLLFP